MNSMPGLPSTDQLHQIDTQFQDCFQSYRQNPSVFQVKPAIENYLRATATETSGELDLGHGDSLVLLMVDGLGYELISNYRAYARNLWSVIKDTQPMVTSMPSTTAAAISSTLLGAKPAQSNMVGYQVYYRNKLFNLLNFLNAPVDPGEYQPLPSIFSKLQESGIPARAFLPAKYHRPGLTTAAMKSAELVEAADLRSALAKLKSNSATGFNYLYSNMVDHAGHAHGVGSDQWLAKLEEIDSLVMQMRRELSEKTKFIIMADHGMVNADPSKQIYLANSSHLAAGVKFLAGEPRCLHVHLDEGQDPGVTYEAWKEELAGKAWVLNAEEQSMALGGKSDKTGDFMVMMKSDYTLFDGRSGKPTAPTLPGVHGSLTSTEMLVPFAEV
ncbi:alkaline phosphatase family protein [Boudabousia liubingyangii]|nr:alkaline phosphatase family protein [Boudabousia liubingyangii]